MVRRAVILAICALVAGGAGCGNLFSWMVAPRHPMQTVKAEYALEAERLVIVPYVGTDILLAEATVPLEVSRDIVNEIGLHVRGRVRTLVHPVAVIQWQESNLEWPNMSLPEIAKAFQCDTVLYVEVERYSVYEERSANLFRGRIRARIQVAKADAAQNPVFETTVETTFPEDRPVGVLETSERQIRAGTTLMFARAVVRKFYDHEVEIKGGRQ
jgi:hypothetical protein